MAGRSKLVAPGIERIINETKAEVAAELGVNLGAGATAQENGTVGGAYGGQITKNLVALALKQMENE